MTIIRQISWTEQPQETVDLQPAIAQHLSVLALGAQRDFLGCGAVTEAGGITRGPSHVGLAWQGDGTDNVAYATPNRDGSITAAGNHYFTLITVFRKRAAGASTGHIAGYGASTGGAGTTLHRLVGGSTSDQIQLQLQTSGGNLLYNTASSSANINDQGWHCAVVPYQCTSTIADDAAVYWIDGVKQGTVARSSVAQNTTFNRASVGATLRTGTIGPGNWDVALYVHLLTRMPDDWCARASQIGSVWDAVFAPRIQRIWASVSSGAYSLIANNGTYSYTGQTATLLRNKVIEAAQGSYAITGQTAGVYRNRTLTANNGSYTVTGQDASIFKTKLITASAGSYSLSGQDATITYVGSGTNYSLVAAKGDYTYTGQTATLKRSKLITASNGTYSITGQNANIAYSGTNTITLKAGSWIRYRIIT
jgi:hypothetical protein